MRLKASAEPGLFAARNLNAALLGPQPTQPQVNVPAGARLVFISIIGGPYNPEVVGAVECTLQIGNTIGIVIPDNVPFTLGEDELKHFCGPLGVLITGVARTVCIIHAAYPEDTAR